MCARPSSSKTIPAWANALHPDESSKPENLFSRFFSRLPGLSHAPPLRRSCPRISAVEAVRSWGEGYALPSTPTTGAGLVVFNSEHLEKLRVNCSYTGSCCCCDSSGAHVNLTHGRNNLLALIPRRSNPRRPKFASVVVIPGFIATTSSKPGNPYTKEQQHEKATPPPNVLHTHLHRMQQR